MTKIKTWCLQCGPRVSVDIDGHCEICGALAVGFEVDEIDRAFTDKDNWIAFLENTIKCIENAVRSSGNRLERMRTIKEIFVGYRKDAKRIFNMVIK